MIKVIEFIPTLNDGGAENLVKDYALKLNEDELEVIIITLQDYFREPTVVYQTLKDAGIKLENCYGSRIPIRSHVSIFTKVWYKFFDKWWVCRKLKRIIKKTNPDVIHAHMSVLKYLCGIRKSLNGIKLFYTCHSLPQRWLNSSGKEFLAAKELIKNNNLQIIALHNQMRLEINEMFGIENTIVLNNGIDFEKFFQVAEDKNKIREALNIPKEAFVIGNVARFVKSKNHDLMIEIFNKIYTNNKNAFLLLVGHGSKEIEKKILYKVNKYNLSDRVLILSHRSDIPKLMKAMDVFLFPSEFEGFGIVLLEAQVMGLRCVISDTVPRETILSSQTVSVSLDASLQEWSKAICDNSIISEEYGCLNDYEINNVVKKLKKLYGI